MKEIVSQPTNGVICEDGKIAKNGLRVICSAHFVGKSVYPRDAAEA